MQQQQQRPSSNLIYLRADRNFKFYIFLSKQLLKNQFTTLEVHGAGEVSVSMAINLAGVLVNH